MDVFFVVLGLLLLAFPIMAIAALVKTIGIRGQLRQVEVRLAALERARDGTGAGHTGGARAGIFRARAATANRAVGRAPGASRLRRANPSRSSPHPRPSHRRRPPHRRDPRRPP